MSILTESTAINMYLNKTVEVLDTVGKGANHPTAMRHLQKGDQLLIEAVCTRDGKVWLGYKARHCVSKMFGVGWQAVDPDRVTLTRLTSAKPDLSHECVCPDILWGHHPGCHYYRTPR